MCRGDLPSRLCSQCVVLAKDRIWSNCRFSKEAVIWYSHCLLRYSEADIRSTYIASPLFSEFNMTSSFISTQQQNFFNTLSGILLRLTNLTGDNGNRYLTDKSKLNPFQTLYTLAQCTPDLSSDDCTNCLRDVIGSAIPWARLGSVGGRVLCPSCTLRFQLFQFYRADDDAPPPELPGPSATGQRLCEMYMLIEPSHHVALQVWRQWRDNISLSILDPNIKNNYSEIEVLKCIRIGLLCVQQDPDARPTMASVVTYLSSHSIELPLPQEPAFFMDKKMDQRAAAQESSSSSHPLSQNEMSISNFLPR